jgi:DNA-binding NtrC family response regulator
VGAVLRESVRKAITTTLENKGYVVDVAENGKEAIEKSKTAFYNLALIDIRLPDMEGTELLTALKEITPEMIKIILTGYPTLQNAVEAVNRGANGYFMKPANMDELLRTIAQHPKEQSELKEYGERRIAQYVEARSKELETEKRHT